MLRYEVASPTLVATSQTKIADTVKTCLLQYQYTKIIYYFCNTYIAILVCLKML